MQTRLFDVQAEFESAALGNKHIVSHAELKADMARCSIERALVRIGPEALSVDRVHANRQLYRLCAADTSLVPCPALAPNTAHDLADEEEQVDEAIAHGAGAAFLRPAHDCWLLEPWACDRLFQVLQDRRLPAFCLQRMVPPAAAANLAGRFPQLPIIYAEGNYRYLRIYLPLLEQFTNISLSLGNNFHVHRGLEHMLRHGRAGQLLFGTGFPAAEPMAAVTQLMFADLPDETRLMIGAGNLERLLEGIRHG